MTIEPIQTTSSAPARGLLMIHTGNGKGKSTSALGLMVRVLGRGGQSVQYFQFVRVPMDVCGEYQMLAQLGVAMVGMGDARGLKHRLPDNAQAQADGVWAQAKAAILSGENHLVVLDDITVPLANGWLHIEALMDTLDKRPVGVNVCLIGRRFPPELLAQADSVTKMSTLKQPLHTGVAVERAPSRSLFRLS